VLLVAKVINISWLTFLAPYFFKKWLNLIGSVGPCQKLDTHEKNTTKFVLINDPSGDVPK